MNIYEARREFRDTYMIEIPSDKERGIKDYLRSLAQGDTFERRTLFDVAGRHESQICREWATEYLITHTSIDDKRDVVEMWIRNPYHILNRVILDFINSYEMSEQTALKAAVFVLLDEENEAQKVDPNFESLELFIQNDPMLLAPIAERLTKIRLREFQRVVSDRTITEMHFPSDENESNYISRSLGALSRSLRTEDWSLAWQILKESSFVSIVDSLKYFKLSNWFPENSVDKELYQYLSEYVGFKGWKPCSDLLQEVIFDKSQRYKGIKFEVMDILKNPPPSFSLTTNNLEFQLDSLDGIQRKFLRVSSGNNIIVNISIPSYYDVSIDETGIKSILCPLSSLRTEEYSWVTNKTQELIDSEDFYERKVLRYFLALQKLIEMQSRRGFHFDYDIFEQNESSNSVDSHKKSTSSNVVIGIDFGNSTSVVTCINRQNLSIIPGKELLNNPQDTAFECTEEGLFLPSIIYYKSGGVKLVGLDAEKYREHNETFKLIKRSLRRGWSSGIKVEERRVKAPQAAKDFILEIGNRIKVKRENIHKICFTAPVDAPIQYQETIRSAIAQAFNVSESHLEVYDEATAAILGLRENISANKSTLVVDIGGGTTDVAVVSVDANSPESRIFYRSSEDLGGADIEGIAFYECRDKFEEDIPKSVELIMKCREAKHQLADEGKMMPIALSEKTEHISFSIKELNEWLEKDEFVNKFNSLIDDAIVYGKNAGSGDIEQYVLAGGGSKWPLFKEILMEKSKGAKLFHLPDIFAVAKGASRAALGLSIKTSLPYPLGVLRSSAGNLVFEVLIKKGETIPSRVFEISFVSVDSIQEEIELDFRRRRIKKEGEKFLLYGKDGKPFMKKGEGMTFYEPLRDAPLYVNLNQKCRVWINDKGSLFLKEMSSKEVHDLGSIL